MSTKQSKIPRSSLKKCNLKISVKHNIYIMKKMRLRISFYFLSYFEQYDKYGTNLMSYRDKIHVLNLVLRVVHYKTNTLAIINKMVYQYIGSMLHSLLFALLVCPLSDQRKEIKVNKQGKENLPFYIPLHSYFLVLSGQEKN